MSCQLRGRSSRMRKREEHIFGTKQREGCNGPGQHQTLQARLFLAGNLQRICPPSRRQTPAGEGAAGAARTPVRERAVEGRVVVREHAARRRAVVLPQRASPPLRLVVWRDKRRISRTWGAKMMRPLPLKNSNQLLPLQTRSGSGKRSRMPRQARPTFGIKQPAKHRGEDLPSP